MKPQPASHILVIGRRRKPKAPRADNEQARRLRFIALAYANWQRKMGIIPDESESE